MGLTPEHGSLPSHRIREERLDRTHHQQAMHRTSSKHHTHQDRHATLTGGTANGFFRMPVVVFCRVCVSVLMILDQLLDGQ
jgi:hypothetical protein